jgi:hypothetical protein
LTTSNTPNLPNVVVAVPNTSAGSGVASLSMQIKIVAVPEPASLALVGLALAGVAAVTRRRS